VVQPFEDWSPRAATAALLGDPYATPSTSIWPAAVTEARSALAQMKLCASREQTRGEEISDRAGLHDMSPRHAEHLRIVVRIVLGLLEQIDAYKPERGRSRLTVQTRTPIAPAMPR
jgi:hypothetical protein